MKNNKENLGSYLAFATKRAEETGQSVDYLVDSIIMGIGRKSPMILDNLGISIVDIRNEMEKTGYRDWETDRKSTRLNSSHSAKSRMPSSA